MDQNSFLARHLPTVATWLEQRAEGKRNQLPEHLRPRPVWPIWIQIVLNVGLAYTLCHLMFYRDDYFTEAGPASILGICTFLLIFTIIEGIRYYRHYRGRDGQRLSTVNLVLTGIAFLCLPLAIAMFLN
jgi:hypothetical protein